MTLTPPSNIFSILQISSSEIEAITGAAAQIGELIADTILEKGECRMIISGGSAIELTLNALKLYEAPWERVFVYVADERCVEVVSDLRNDRMIAQNLVGHLLIPTNHFFRIKAELGRRYAAEEYGRILLAVNRFDIALLGVGSDGHISSLFPIHHALQADAYCVFIDDSPKPPTNRVSIGLKVLQSATHRIVVVVEFEKAELIGRIANGAHLPVTLFNPTNWHLDEAAIFISIGNNCSSKNGRLN